MRVLAIETSCDETGISVINATGTPNTGIEFDIEADTLSSQASLHADYGGVYPTLAKREHKKALPVLLKEVEELVDTSSVDVIAVTNGPGLEPALWTGITFAQTLASELHKPLVPVNHMEGHIYSALMQQKDESTYTVQVPSYPAVALLVSGGHTDIVEMSDFYNYKYLGGTLDDAVGEAFDKVARMLSLGYPGGPVISKLAQQARADKLPPLDKPLPRPMLKSGDANFSFSGLKTAVLYRVKEFNKLHNNNIPEDMIKQLAREFEDAVADVLSQKLYKEVESIGAKSVIIGGGVSANVYLNESIAEKLSSLNIDIYKPNRLYSGDNALMIAIAGYARAIEGGAVQDPSVVSAHGKLKLS